MSNIPREDFLIAGFAVGAVLLVLLFPVMVLSFR
jgi:hypothetical protein